MVVGAWLRGCGCGGGMWWWGVWGERPLRTLFHIPTLLSALRLPPPPPPLPPSCLPPPTPSQPLLPVGILLFLKMLLLPLMLGVCLDAATLVIFGSEAGDRIRFTAQNLVGSLLLHWVLGITFMLFVTVSVLQVCGVWGPGGVVIGVG